MITQVTDTAVSVVVILIVLVRINFSTKVIVGAVGRHRLTMYSIEQLLLMGRLLAYERKKGIVKDLNSECQNEYSCNGHRCFCGALLYQK